MVRTVAGLWYQECLLLADDEAREWRLLRVDVPGEDEEPILAAYCPELLTGVWPEPRYELRPKRPA
jgi:hypothetical protein